MRMGLATQYSKAVGKCWSSWQMTIHFGVATELPEYLYKVPLDERFSFAPLARTGSGLFLQGFRQPSNG